VDETKILGVQQAREQLRDRIDAALELGEHTVVTRAGRPGNPYNNDPANLTLVRIDENSSRAERGS
jgi:hypothetical protein